MYKRLRTNSHRAVRGSLVRGILIKLKLRKPNKYVIPDKNVIEKNEPDIHGTVGDSTIDLRTRSSSMNSNPNSLNSDYQSEETLYENIYETSYLLCGFEKKRCLPKTLAKKKRLPNAGSNFSKIPILSEIPKIQNPAAWVSSKTQKDTKPIRN